MEELTTSKTIVGEGGGNHFKMLYTNTVKSKWPAEHSLWVQPIPIILHFVIFCDPRTSKKEDP